MWFGAVYTFLVGKEGKALMSQEVRTQLGGEEDVVSIHLHLNTPSCKQQQLQQQQGLRVRRMLCPSTSILTLPPVNNNSCNNNKS
jgi:hypothetical protein